MASPNPTPSLPRGIDPELLVAQVRNTAPYLFEAGAAAPARDFPGARPVLAFAEAPRELTHVEYFELCLGAHYLTVGTPVPTDVDNQIRARLWPRELPVADALVMAELVLASRAWDWTRVSNRFTHGAGEQASRLVTGLQGEWFTVAAAAYAALGRYREPEARELRARVLAAIANETSAHAEVFASLWRAREGLRCLTASASIAHNFGDLDRVMDMWELPVGDELRLGFYKLTHSPYDADRRLRLQGRLWIAGELYKTPLDLGPAGESSMAFENHRHFALRKPRALRRDPAFLVPTGPFFDAWGETVAAGLAGAGGESSEDTHDVVAALWHGWDRQPRTTGYGRALRAFVERHPGLELPKDTRVRDVRSKLQLSREAFERRWADQALAELEEIPSRA